jgi:hypothetical protein
MNSVIFDATKSGISAIINLGIAGTKFIAQAIRGITTATPSATTSTLTAVPTSFATDSSSTLTFTALDADGNPVPNYVPIVEVELSASIVLGPGPNALDWAGKTTYTEELFDSPIPVRTSPTVTANAAGFLGFEGFSGFTFWNGSSYQQYAYEHTYVSYPVVSTPIGTKPVLRQHYNGTTKDITGVNETTDGWAAGGRGWSVRVSGTWIGTLQFELSTDGGATWSAVSMDGQNGSQGGVTGTSTSINGSWRQTTAGPAGSIFRVRASSWTSGTAKVDVGQVSSTGAGRFQAGTFTGNPTRFYTRSLLYVSSNWTNSNNAGTKWLFFSQVESNNHYFNLLFGTLSTVRADIHLQNSVVGSSNFNGDAGPAFGTWLDVETLVIANTPGVANGIGKIWINGTLLLDRSDIPYFMSGATPRFVELFEDATYGGGFSPPDKNIYFDTAAMYRESAP